MYYRFGKVFYFLSVLVFLFTLLYFYAALPEQIGFRLDDQGIILRDYAKSTFFYTLAIGFLLLNLVTIYTPKTLETKTNRKLHRIFPIGDPFRDYLLTWFYLMPIILFVWVGGLFVLLFKKFKATQVGVN